MKKNIGFVWTEEKSDGRVNIGFTRAFIDSKLMECFACVQADAFNLFEGGPMLVIETNDGLESLKSPITGTITNFNAKARNFPDRLTEDDVILTVLPKGVVLPAKAKTKKVTLQETLERFPNAQGDWLRVLNEVENRNREQE